MKLTELQQRVFDVLDARPNTDVPIKIIFTALLTGREEQKLFPDTVRDMQQQLGPIIARINSKLKRGRVEPGHVKQTYRLNTQLER